MTRQEAIESLQFMAKSYQALIDNDIRSGNIICGELLGEWQSEDSLENIYQIHIDALNMAIRSLEAWDKVKEDIAQLDKESLCVDYDFYFGVGMVEKFINKRLSEAENEY